MTEQKKKIKKSGKNAIVVLLLVAFVLLLLIPKDIIKNPQLIGKVIAQVRIKTGTIPPYFVENLTNQTSTQGQRFVYDINCSDLELGDTVSYSDNFTGFVINPSTGLINKN